MTANVGGVPPKGWLEMTFKASASLFEFAKTAVCPELRAKENKTEFEIAVMSTYNRMYLWLGDSLAAKEPIRFQIAATCARSMFEHLVDLKWLTMNPSSAVAFNDFTIVRRFDMADKILKESLRNPYMNVKPFKQAITLATRPKSRAMRDNLCLQHGWVNKNGQPKSPQHWWGQNIEKRALAVDPKGRKYIAFYMTLYADLSSQVHPGAVGLANISAEGVLGLFIASHHKTQDFFREATDLVCQHFPMPLKVKSEFQDKFSDDAVWGMYDHVSKKAI